MNRLLLSRVAGGIIIVLLVGGAAITRSRWVPYVFPAKEAAKAPAGDGHGSEGGGHAGHDHAAHDHGSADRVKLSPQAQANLKLDVDALVPESYFRKLLIPGIVVDRPGETDRGITARTAGIVVDIRARPGDTVRAGDPLFTIQLVSELVQGTQTELAKAARELGFAQTKRDRTANLVKLGTKPQSELTEDENQVRRFQTQVQAYRRQLATFGLTSEQVTSAEGGEVVTEVVVRAPERSAAGPAAAAPKAPVTPNAPAEPTVYEVQELKVQLGESVPAGHTLALLSNHQMLFVEGRAFKSEAKVLSMAAKESWEVTAEFAEEMPGEWEPLPPLTIRHLSNAVDPMTRTFGFYLPLKNQSETYAKDGRTFFVWRFRPGQRVRLKVPVEKLGDEVFVLPATAVVREGGEAYVFRQNGDYFERKPVKVLHEDRSEVVLANDGSVGPGQFVARNQAAALNRAIKAAAGGGGGHEGHDHAH